MDDVFYTDSTDFENEKKIFEIEEQNKIEKIKNDSFNQGYLSKATEFDNDSYNKGLKEGENYSIEYGKLMGVIECIKFFDNLNAFKSNNIPTETKNELDSISQELEEFKDKLDDNLIRTYNEKLNKLLQIFINN